MIVVSGIIQFDPEYRDEALRRVEPVIAATNEEVGCISYSYFEDPWVPGRFRIFEEWTDQGALDAHLDAPHMTSFRGSLADLGGIRADISKYVVSTVGPVR